VRQALCFGWIDGVRKNAGEDGYANRFSPRQQRSPWSALNLKRYQELGALGLIAEPGRRAYERRNPGVDGYAIADREDATLSIQHQQKFAAHPEAWEFYRLQAPWYRRTTAHWIASAKREETRERRLAQLIADSAVGRRIAPLDAERYQTQQTQRPAKRGAA
jgi:uncharacterized protein YdeI (YjbR/CyaY-like superfamily)